MALARRGDAYHYDGSLEALAPAASEAGEVHRLPLAREVIDVHREARVTGRVRVVRRVEEHTEIIDEPVVQEHAVVRRVPVGRVVDGPVPVRHEGDTVIIPVLEERLVVMRQLVLKEEVHVERQRTRHEATQAVTLRRTHAVVERLGADPRGNPEAASPNPTSPDGAERTP